MRRDVGDLTPAQLADHEELVEAVRDLALAAGTTTLEGEDLRDATATVAELTRLLSKASVERVVRAGFLAPRELALQFLHADPDQPAFIPWLTATRRWQDCGADARYDMAPVSGDHRYRVSGRMGEECYLSLTMYAGDVGHPATMALNVNHRDLGIEPGQEFSLDVDPPADGCYIIARRYFTDRPTPWATRRRGRARPAAAAAPPTRPTPWARTPSRTARPW